MPGGGEGVSLGVGDILGVGARDGVAEGAAVGVGSGVSDGAVVGEGDGNAVLVGIGVSDGETAGAEVTVGDAVTSVAVGTGPHAASSRMPKQASKDEDFTFLSNLLRHTRKAPVRSGSRVSAGPRQWLLSEVCS